MKTTTLRLRRVRFKSGGTLEVLRPIPQQSEILRRFSESAANCAADPEMQDMAGYAIVAWSVQSSVFVGYQQAAQCSIPAGHLPQYVKDCLLAETAGRWMKD